MYIYIYIRLPCKASRKPMDMRSSRERLVLWDPVPLDHAKMTGQSVNLRSMARPLGL
jgi:hypothetical protein